ncbi:putative cytochrome p450 [Diplodia seriata]|uniref:Putative cytochrome p450 n=1 Tax=Diplodia seriata TaxID=420778 RepID=A0A0G2EJ19_9PEZI|nr:putative cytochrome p450 [Diplodia seriata]
MLTPALIASVIPLYLAWSALSLYNNVRRAKATGLRVHISPISPNNPIWLIFEPLIVRSLEMLLGVNNTNELLRMSKRSWNFHDRFRMHERYGKVFAHATPADIEIYVADAAASDELLSRKRDFIKPMHMVEVINVYGPSVASSDGAKWARHRRISATPFNERLNQLVWTEALRQTTGMLAYFGRGIGVGGSSSLAEDSMTLTLNILTSAGLGFSCDFRGAEEVEEKESSIREADKQYQQQGQQTTTTPSYRDCLAGVLDNFLMMGLLPKFVWSLPQSLLPKKLQDFSTHKHTLKQYMVGMVEKTRYEGSEHANLLSVLVQKNEEARQSKGPPSTGGKPLQGLSDDELYGNVFIYSFAGHETTAHAVCYAMYLLAAYPDVQDWVAEEAQAVLGTAELENLAYSEVFPRLKRSLGVMYETLRLYPPVVSIPKSTGPSPQTLTVPSPDPTTTTGFTATLPAHAYVFPNVVALQSHPDYWGADSLTWNPARWIEVGEEGESFKPAPVKGNFIPWADGPRVCPGKKFSQVEFVAVIAAVVRGHRVEVVREGEGEDEARKRVLEVVEEMVSGATLFMKHPEKVRVRIVKR